MTERPGGSAVPDEPPPADAADAADDPTDPAAPDLAADEAVPPEHRPSVPAELLEPADTSFEAPGQPERERRALGPTRRRRASRAGTNPAADTSPDTAAERDPAPAGEGARDRWLREQRPPHWE